MGWDGWSVERIGPLPDIVLLDDLIRATSLDDGDEFQTLIVYYAQPEYALFITLAFRNLN